MAQAANWKKIVPLSLVATAALFAILWWLDFPRPYMDDLFFCGAALNLASGGDFSNPLLARQNFPSHYYFVHPPLFSFTLAGWLKIVGISAGSVTGFEVLMYLITAGATIAILRRNEAARWLEWLVPLGVCGAFLNCGLREEPLAVALTMSGFALIEYEGERSFHVFLGFLLMFLGCSAAPRLTVFSAFMALAAGYKLWRSPTPASLNRRTLFLVAFAAALVSCLFFLVMIRFQLGEFLKTFRFHAAGRVGGSKFELLHTYLVFYTGNTLWPVMALALVFFFIALSKPKSDLGRTGLMVLCAFPVVASIGGLGFCSVWYAMVVVLFLSSSLLKNVARSGRIFLGCAVVFAFVSANIINMTYLCGILAGKSDETNEGSRAEALALQSTTEHPVLLDSAAARYVYGFKVPPGYIDIQWSAPFPAVYLGGVLHPGDIFVVGEYSVQALRTQTYLDQATPKFSFLRRPYWPFFKYPRRISIIPEETCKGIRTNVMWQGFAPKGQGF